MKVRRKIIEIDEEKCDGCGQCALSCAEGSLEIINGKAKVISENLCDGLGACIGECPRGALRIVERVADEFDETAVEHHLAKRKDKPDMPPSPVPAGGGCPSAGIRLFAPAAAVKDAGLGHLARTNDSALSHWPIQIRLVPPNAAFLKNADLLVLADCGAVAFPTLHQDLLKGRVVLMGCPKFDDADDYVQRFAAIFRQAAIMRVTAVYMEVPCCAALPVIVQKAMDMAGVSIPMAKMMIGVRGQVMDKE
jgi:NAD-dependent dihydropyrimidine dehydrogenase PreA subunit